MLSIQSEVTLGKGTLSLERFLRLLLLHESATRKELGKRSGFSAASITLRSQWLLENRFLERLAEKRRHSKRPVEKLFLKRKPWAVGALRLKASGIHVDLFDSQGNTLWSAEQSFRKRIKSVQNEAFRTLRELLFAAQIEAEKVGLPLKGVGLGVDGMISGNMRAGMIFQLNGLQNWIPCQPPFIDPLLQQIGVIGQWTSCACKLMGLARQLETDRRIAYFQITRDDLRLAVMVDGVMTLGNLGTSGAFLHQSVQMGGPACFCGRQGCLDTLLRAGKATHEQIYGAIQRLLEALQITHAGIEWGGGPECLPEILGLNSRRVVIPVSDPEPLENSGLGMLSLEAALLHEVSQLQRAAS